MDDGEAEEGELEEEEAAQEPQDTAMPDADAEGLMASIMSSRANFCSACHLLCKIMCCTLVNSHTDRLPLP